MLVIHFLFSALLIYLSFKSFRGGMDYLNYFKQELAKPPADFTPFATVIAPCKGLDEGLAENLSVLLSQDYPAYEVLFVVDDADDPAVRVFEEISRKGKKRAKMIVAQRATASSQKVENLREAVLHADERSEVLVFVDSDVRPGADWLGSLISPLANENIGAATGYRWFVSENTSFAGELRSAWNASIASALGPNMESNFCWGGSTAIRRDVFERLRIRERWIGTLSDDFTVTRAIKEAGLPIRFVPRAVVPSGGDCSIGGLLEFTNRQMKITRVYAPKLWLMSFFGSGLFNAVMISSVVILLLYPALTFPWLSALITLITVTAFSVGKSWLRCAAVRLALPLQTHILDRQFRYQITLWLLTPAVFLINCISTAFSTKIEWRGTKYEMISPTETRIARLSSE